MSIDPRRYQRLDAGAVAETLQRLHNRIAARFPERSLADLARAVGDVTESVERASRERVAQTRPVRAACSVGAAVVAALALIAIALSVRDAFRAAEGTPAFEWLPIVESGINDVVFAGIAIYFLLSVPSRLARRRTLALLYRLRSLAHVIDMHQLTKDPERLLAAPVPTVSSVVPDLDSVGLGRYLDYCSELLSLVGKSAALCAQESTDAIVLDTVSEIESLTVGMARKIWQKISLLHAAG